MRPLSWRLILYVITFVLFTLAIMLWILTFVGWLITEPGFEPLHTFVEALVFSLGGLLALLRARTVPDTAVITYSPTPEQRQRTRRAMLELVKSFWVKGVLKQSLHGAAMIELGLEERADAVERPWDMLLQTPDRPASPLPRGTKIVEVFEEMNRALLILGEPGSGKTTMLLELAHDTIARAEGDLTQPIPVVFNLLSWAEKRQPIAEWLVDELNTKYNIPKKIAHPWVEHDDLLLLLDGLDEVALECREDCVRAINDFRQEHMVPLAVCSRIADYEVLATRLKLQGAVLLQPLTPQQIEEYLRRADIELFEVRRTLQHDPMLQELTKSPLILSIMTLAYQGMSVKDLGALDSIEVRRRHVLDTYVQRMFERRGIDQHCSPEQTVRWLAWLAQKMSQHAQAIFLIERMQPGWLQTGAQRRRYVIILRLIFVLIFVLSFGLSFWLILGLNLGLIFGLSMGLSGGLSVGLIDGSIYLIESTELVKWSWREAKKRVMPVLIGVLSGCLILGPTFGLIFSRILGAGLIGGLIGGLIFVLIGGLIPGLSIGLLRGLTSTEIEVKTIPNQGIRQSVRNAVFVGLSAGLIVGLSIGLTMGLIFWLSIGLSAGLRVGLSNGVFFLLVVGLSAGLRFGGRAAIQHFTLRFILYRNGHIPWDYARFLDYTAERIFLRKVGGGYIFVHRLVQDYFASLYQGQ